MENVTIRPATKDDIDDIFNMIQELANFEKMPDGPTLTKEILLRDGGFDQENRETRPYFYAFVAEHENNATSKKQTIGYMVLYYFYSTWKGKSLFLDELYVKPEYRKCGAGKLLFKNAIQFALDNGCARFDFHVLKWNPAKTFYVKMGATNLTETDEWEIFRMTQEDLEKAVKNF